MYYILLYDVVENYIERRALYREAHLQLAQQAHQRGELIMAGAFADPVDGAALVFRTNDPTVPTRFAQQDPYVKNGLVKSWRVRPWHVVIGG
jgi:hypothetical protein